jgi:hypothetical protein
MAGLGHKTFTRERLTSADVQGYLMDQVTLVYPSASARLADLPAPDDGMRSYLLDVKRTEVYDAASGAWVCREALGLVDRGAMTATAATDGTTTEQRIIGVVNRVVDLIPGRTYRVECKGRGSSAAVPARGALNVRARRGGTPVATDTVLAGDAKVYGNAGASGSQDLYATGLFAVTVAGSYTLSPFLVTSASTLSLAPDARGIVETVITDVGPASPGLITLS